MSNAITYESKRGAEKLAAFWDQSQKTDQLSIEEFLKVLDVNVLVNVKVDLAGLVRNSLGKAVTKPESTDMYKVLQNIIMRYTNELTLGRARALTTNTKMKGNSPSEVSIAIITITAVMIFWHDHAIVCLFTLIFFVNMLYYE